jgi:hypothetical protein
MAVERTIVSEPFVRVNTILGEGPFYREEDDTVHFVDIIAKLIYSVPLSSSKAVKAIKVEDSPGVAALVENDDKHYAVAAKRGFGLVDQETGKLTYLAKVFRNADEEKRFAKVSALSDDVGRDSMMVQSIVWDDFGPAPCLSLYPLDWPTDPSFGHSYLNENEPEGACGPNFC